MISQRELSQIRSDFSRSLNDTVVHLSRSTATGTYGQPVRTFSTVATWSAGIAFSPFKFRSRERGDEIGEQVGEIYVRCRIPYEASGTIDKEDQLVLIKQFGLPVTPPKVFEVQGFEEVTVGGLIINLRRVEL